MLSALLLRMAGNDGSSVTPDGTLGGGYDAEYNQPPLESGLDWDGISHEFVDSFE